MARFKIIRLGTDKFTRPGREYGVWDAEAPEIGALPDDPLGCTVAEGMTRWEAEDAAERWNHRPRLSPMYGAFHDPTFFGLIKPKPTKDR